MIQNSFIMEKLRTTCDTLKKQILSPYEDIVGLEIAPGEYQEQLTPPADGWRPFVPGERVEGYDAHFWFRGKIHTPAAQEGKRIMLQIHTGFEEKWNSRNPQCLIYLNGVMTQAMDTNHYRVPLECDTEYDLLVSFWVGMDRVKVDFLPSLVWNDDRIEGMYYDLFVPYEGCKLYENDGVTYARVTTVLERAVNLIRFQEPFSPEYYESLEAARAFLKEEFYEKMCGDTDAIVN